MASLPGPDYLTKKQVRAFRRAEKRRGEKALKIGMCRITTRAKGGRVVICRAQAGHGHTGYYMTMSPARLKRATSGRMSPLARAQYRGW